MLNRTLYKLHLKNRNKLKANDSFRIEARKLNLILQSTLVVFLFCLIIGITDFYFGNYKSAYNDFSLALICIGCFFLFYKGYINSAKVILVFCTLLIITINASREGREAGNQYLWFCTIVGTFTLFSLKEKKYLIGTLLMCFASLLFCEITDYSFFKSKEYDAQWILTNHKIVIALSLIVVIFFLTFIARSLNISIKDKDKNLQIIDKQKQEVEVANQELDKFVYHASHDLRSPILSLIGLVEVAKETDNINKLKELILKQEATLHGLDKHLLNILTLAKVKNSSINYVEINFQEILDEVLIQCQLMLAEKGIKVNINNRLKRNIISDPMRLDKILYNLISNSIKYCDHLKNKQKIDISIEQSESELILIIEDNGIGIDAQKLKIIEQKVHSNEIGKSGLGLQIVQETIDSLNGDMKIESKLGLFTRVSVQLKIPLTV